MTPDRQAELRAFACVRSEQNKHDPYCTAWLLEALDALAVALAQLTEAETTVKQLLDVMLEWALDSEEMAEWRPVRDKAFAFLAALRAGEP